MTTLQVYKPHRKPRKDDVEHCIDPLYHSLSKINGTVNKMNRRQLQKQLDLLGLYNRGVAEVLRKRLKNHYKIQKLHQEATTSGQCYPYLAVLDFEATCEEDAPHDYLHEVIEFPVVIIDTTKGKIVDEFHSYCKPTLNPTLSQFCKQLTGITQHNVDHAPLFNNVFEQFESWLREHGLLRARQCTFITDGSWDFSRFLNVQCCLSDVKYPKWAKKWINLKKTFGNFYKLKKPRIEGMLQSIGLEFEGRLHCGRDDARNLARIVIRLIEDGAMFQVNERLRDGALESIPEEERLQLTETMFQKKKDACSEDVDTVTKLMEEGLQLDSEETS